MGKKLWNYFYSLLLSIILLLLIGIFLNLNNDEHYLDRNTTIDKQKNNNNSIGSETTEPSSEKRAALLHEFIDQQYKESPLFNKFITGRKKEDVKGKVAIIIDDMGYQRDVAEKIINLDYPITVSVLPFLPHSQAVAEMAKEKGLTVLLHLPMEPLNSGVDPGEGAILTNMDEQEIRTKILDGIEEIPYIEGVNNHMGSKATEEDHIMITVLGELKKRNLFFVDSMTTPHSIGYHLSKKMNIKTAQRDVFLDNEQNTDYILNQVMILKDIAQKKGSAIAIGHPYSSTVDVLLRLDSILEKEGIKIVPIKELLE